MDRLEEKLRYFQPLEGFLSGRTAIATQPKKRHKVGRKEPTLTLDEPHRISLI